MTQEEIGNLSKAVTNKAIKSVIKKSQQGKAQDQMASLENSIKYLEKKYHHFSNS